MGEKRARPADPSASKIRVAASGPTDYRPVMTNDAVLRSQPRPPEADSSPSPAALDYRRIAKAIRYLEAHARAQPTLAEVADHLGMSEFHTQRLFTRWAGVSPKRFLQFITLDRAKDLLRASESVLAASHGSGLSSPGRLHDLFVTLEGVTPGEFKSGGRGIRIRWGVHETPFGDALLAATERGLCALRFLAEEGEGPGRAEALETLRSEWPDARLEESPSALAPAARALFGGDAAGETGGFLLDDDGSGPTRLRLHVRGTNFQIRVWEALLRIPPGAAVTYGDLARAVGRPEAARAVGGAVGRNPVAFLIPCHRVLRSTGHFGGYRWGAVRKRAILAWEIGRAG